MTLKEIFVFRHLNYFTVERFLRGSFRNFYFFFPDSLGLNLVELLDDLIVLFDEFMLFLVVC